MKSEHESVDTKSTQDKKKICEACQKRETEKNDSIMKNVEEIEIYDRKKTGRNYSYRVLFYTIGDECFFEYSLYDNIERYDKERTDFLFSLTNENNEKVYDFEHKMHEKYPEYIYNIKNKKVTYPEYKNIKRYKINENYSMMFFTLGRHAIFRYFEDDGLEVSGIDRSCVLYWLSGEEAEKLFNFENEIIEEYAKYIF